MSEQETENSIVHDIRGQICPSSLLFALKEVNEQQSLLREGQIKIVIKTDNRNATSTIPDAVKSMGYDSIVEKKKDYYVIQIMGPKNTGPSV